MKLFLAVTLLVLGCQAQMHQDLNDTLPFIEEIFSTTKQPLTTEIDKQCYTEKQEPGKCVKHSECSDTIEIDLDNQEVYRGLSCSYLKLCCPINRLISEKQPITPLMPQKKPGCGWSNPGGYSFRDSSNSHAEFGEFPWMVAMMRKIDDSQVWDQKDFLGGGTLIHHSVVMTAAHKLRPVRFDASKVKCRIGEWDTQNTDEIYPHQDRDVRKIIAHENFSGKTSANNIALLITATPFDLTDPHVGIACLDYNEPAPGTSCFSMGWGKDFNKQNAYAVWLKKVPLPIVGSPNCEYDLQRSRLGSNYRLHNTLLCAGGQKNFDTCTGDGGSPLVCPISVQGTKRYAVYGMVAFGIECATTLPGVYVNVPTMLDWIKLKFSEEELDMSFFA